MSYLESLRVFVRVVELGSITAGGRDLRLSPAVASNRIKDLENRIRSRLQSGLVVDLHPTDYELRLGILQSKVEAQRANRDHQDDAVDQRLHRFDRQHLHRGRDVFVAAQCA